MTSMDDLFPSKWLKASDIGEHRPVVTILKVSVEVLKGQGGQSENKPVLWFKGKEKAMVLNKTNATAVAKIAGTKEIEKWAGTKVQLFVAEVEAFGEMTEAIRIRKPPQDPSQPEPDFDAEAEAMKAAFDDDSSIPF